MKPICLDFYCGLGGWAEGFLAEGFDVIGFDIERHDYGTGGYPGTLVLQDVLTITGEQFRPIASRIACLVASPPCQEPSYRAMPWKRAKALNAAGPPVQFIKLFEACFRIQREISEVVGRHIPVIVENVVGAQRWVGRAGWHFGSYYLWGDIPALMPIPRSIKNNGGSWFNIAHNTTSGVGQNPDGRKIHASCSERRWENREVKRLQDATKVGGDWFGTYAEQKAAGTISPGRLHGKNSAKRKHASAVIAKIPFPLAHHIAKCFLPITVRASGDAVCQQEPVRTA